MGTAAVVNEVTIAVIGGRGRDAALARQLAGAGLGEVVPITPEGGAVAPLARVDILVVGAGAARLPGAKGAAHVHAAAELVVATLGRTTKHSRDCVVIVAARPADGFCEAIWQRTGLPPERILGVDGGVVAVRARRLLAAAAEVAPASVSAVVLGSGRGALVLPHCLTVGGIPASQLLPPPRLAGLLDEAARGGQDAGDLIEAVRQVVAAVVADRRAVLSCCCRLGGEYGMEGLWFGVPCVVGRRGVVRILEVPLDRSESRRVERLAAMARRRLATSGSRREAG